MSKSRGLPLDTGAGSVSSRKQLPEQDLGNPLEVMVQARTLQLMELTTHLQNFAEEEKRKLARELHDELGSLLTAAKLDIAFLKTRCANNEPQIASKFERLGVMLDQGMALQRRVIDKLRPCTLEMLGLASAVRELAESAGHQSKAVVQVEIDDDIAPVGDDALALYRIVQEALTNAQKHAEPTKINVELTREGDQLSLQVEDNGKGFDTSRSNSGFGLLTIRQRVWSRQGQMSIESVPGVGTRLQIRIPYRPPVSPA